MNEKQQVVQMGNELDALVNRWCAEYDTTYAAAVGVLQMKSHTLIVQAIADAEGSAET